MVLFNISQRREKVPDPRPPVDASGTQNLDGVMGEVMAPQSGAEPAKPAEPSGKKRVLSVKEPPYELLPEKDRYMAMINHRAMRHLETLEGLTAQEEAKRLDKITRRAQRSQTVQRLAVPVLSLCVTGVSAIMIGKYGMQTPLGVGASAGAIAGSGTVAHHVAKKKIETSRKKKEAKTPANGSTPADQ